MAKYILVHGIRIAKSFEPETFGRLTTIGPKFLLPYGKTAKRQAFQVCSCTCGNILIIQVACAKRQNVQSCGCLRRDLITKRIIAKNKANVTHGETGKTAEYGSWKGMLERCANRNGKDYHRYGGRGIKVCDRWLGPAGFQNFLADMGRKPSPKHSIDRIDVDDNYCPENCRWATQEEQANNRRTSRYIIFNGEQKSIAQWCKELNLCKAAVRHRLESGWSIHDALTKPTGKYKQKVTLWGESLSIGDWARKYGFTYMAVYNRLQMGWTLEQALTVPQKIRKSHE